MKTHTEIVTLQIEKNKLQSKCDDIQKLVLKFSKGQDNLDKLLGSQKMSFNKEGIEYNSFNKKKAYRNFFVKEAPKNEIICNYCLRIGHISYSCCLRKSKIKITQMWVPKGAKPPYIN